MLSDATRTRLARAGLDADAVEALVRAAIAEDLDGGVDVTASATIPVGQQATLDLVARRPGTVAGIPVAAAVFEVVAAAEGRDVALDLSRSDGERVAAGDVILSATGTTRDLLTAERTALNLLGHLSGIATATREWADALAATSTRVRDTRKTTPLLRGLEKYAVRCGGGVNHRMSLSDAALIKDNHILAAGSVTAAFKAVRQRYPDVPVEIEVDSLDQLTEAVAAGADLILLDNFNVDQLQRATAIVGGRAKLEASGGLSVADAKPVAATGVDFVAVGAITHSAPTLDIGGDLRFA